MISCCKTCHGHRCCWNCVSQQRAVAFSPANKDTSTSGNLDLFAAKTTGACTVMPNHGLTQEPMMPLVSEQESARLIHANQ